MNRHTILLLEDNSERVRKFESAVAQLGADYKLRVWRDTVKMMAECHEVLPDAALVLLDHDLTKEHQDSPDPGDGVQVAEFLARLPMLCPVILHTSNSERVWSVHNAFRFVGWPAEQVMPFGDDWIIRSWLPKAKSLLEQAAAGENAFFRPERAGDHEERLSRAVLSLTGLAIGDGIGEMMFSRPDKAFDLISNDELPGGPWWHTDDTEMAIGIVETLRLLGTIHQDSLARQFAWRFEREPDRGYGSGARMQLRAIVEGAPWRETSREAFGGTGSLGNGSAMRVAPLGAWFADDLDRVVKEARASAMITHMHSEGVAGAVAVAVAAAMAWRVRDQHSDESVVEFFNEVHKRTPDGETRRGIAHAFNVRKMGSIQSAARMLGNGSGVTCPDTVPFTIWCAANHLHDYRKAIAATASVGGDSDTNCAIVGGIVALSTGWSGFSPDWLKGMERLPYKMEVG
jgi:ADP-ribosylglycohydrolase